MKRRVIISSIIGLIGVGLYFASNNLHLSLIIVLIISGFAFAFEKKRNKSIRRNSNTN